MQLSKLTWNWANRKSHQFPLTVGMGSSLEKSQTSWSHHWLERQCQLVIKHCWLLLLLLWPGQKSQRWHRLEVLLVYLCAQWSSNIFQPQLLTSLDPECVVAMGNATLQADVLIGNHPQHDLLWLYGTPLSRGIETIGGLVAHIIMLCNTVWPASWFLYSIAFLYYGSTVLVLY